MLKNLENKLSGKSEKKFNSLHFAFEKHVKRQPLSTALIWKGKNISYKELDCAASTLARKINEYGVGNGSFVPILLSRSPDLVCSLLAVLKAGAAYSIIDPCWPETRVRQVIKALKPTLIISDVSLSFENLHILSPQNQCEKMEESHFSIRIDSLSPACVFFTSGTTGEPKGVISTHKGCIRLFKEEGRSNFNDKTVIPLAAALPWDAFSLELWGALANGGSAWILDEPFLSSEALRKGIREFGVNTIWMTSSLFNMVVDEDIDSFSGLDIVMIGGERVSQAHVKKFINSHGGIKLINGYGPVETTVFATTFQVNLGDCDLPSGIPIGIPVPETQVYILTEEMRLCNDEEIGQIYIAGEGLALGYINDPQLTKLRFKEVIIQGTKKRMYCSGDLGCWKDGLLHFHGRKDRQVKVFGHRVELSEVEHQILKHLKNIKSCRVIAQNDVNNLSQELIAFCIPSNSNDLLENAHSLLKSKLVVYQCPSKVIPVTSFPLTSQGKLDEKALLKHISLHQENTVNRTSGSYKNQMQKTIGKVLSSILKKDSFPMNVHFKELGIKSLDMGRMCARLSNELHRSISLAKLYQYPTISSLGEFLNKIGDDEGQDEDKLNQDGKMNPIQLMYLMQHLINPSNLASRCLMTWSISGNLNLYALENAIVHVHIKNKALRSKYLPDSDSFESSLSTSSPTLQILENQESKTAAIENLRVELSKDLDPLTGKIWRAAIVPIATSRTYIFGCAIHHIAFDGFSEHLLALNLSEGYGSFIKFSKSMDNLIKNLSESSILTPPSLPLHLPEEWQKLVNSLKDVPEISWPRDINKTTERICESTNEHIILIPKSKKESIDKFSIEKKTNRFELLFHAWIHALHQTTGQTDFCVGVPVRQRYNSDTNNTIGCHLNMLCLRLTEKVFKAGILSMKETSRAIQQSLANQDLSFTQILQLIGSQATGRTPLFQTLFALQDNPPPKLALQGLDVKFIRQPYLDLPLELHAEVWPEQEGGLRFVLSHRPECISKNVVQSLAEYFKKNLNELLS